MNDSFNSFTNSELAAPQLASVIGGQVCPCPNTNNGGNNDSDKNDPSEED